MESSVHLTLANFVLRNKLQTCAPESVSFLISDFLIADLPLAGACQLSRAESIALLNLVWMRSQRDNHSDTWSNARLLQTEPRYNRWAFCKTLSQAVEKKDSVLIQWVLQHFPNLPITETIVRKVAENGLLWLLQQLQSERPRRRIGWGKTSYLDAAKAREWEVVHWLLPRCHVSQRFKKQDAQLVLQALDQNNLRELKWVLSLGFTMKHLKLVDPPIHPQLRAIVEAKSLEHGRRGPTDTLETQWRDRTVLVRYLVENGIMPFKNIAEISWRPAARYGDLEFMKWLASKSGSTRRAASNISLVEALKAAADNGHVAIAKWLLGNFRGLVESRALSEAVFLAANGGNLEIVRWLCDKYSSDQGLRLFLKHDAYLSDDELEDEDEENNLSDEIDSNDNGQWNDHGDRRSEAPYKQKPPIQATAMDVAAKNGHLSVLEFLQSVNTTPSNEQQHNGGERGRGGRGGRGGRAGGKRKKAKRQRGRTPYSLGGVYSAYDLNEVWDSLQEETYLESNEELVAWFTENYPRPDEEDVERELELVDNMDGMDNAELLGVYLDAAFGRVFLR
ncbi:uncharacterized protein KRP23_14411 [Phytophthora ramorum]|uniref:uncharacterized protein n=1 Tax=Phytophthora ramorum TaxID=164328 RepID=UPI00309828DB|nr:hypothetical protein KRP23_14411 [Phytophthora ramorum]